MAHQSTLIIQFEGGQFIMDWEAGAESYTDVPGWLLHGLGIRGLRNGDPFTLPIGNGNMHFIKVHSRMDYTRIKSLGYA